MRLDLLQTIEQEVRTTLAVDPYVSRIDWGIKSKVWRFNVEAALVVPREVIIVVVQQDEQ